MSSDLDNCIDEFLKNKSDFFTLYETPVSQMLYDDTTNCITFNFFYQVSMKYDDSRAIQDATNKRLNERKGELMRHVKVIKMQNFHMHTNGETIPAESTLKPFPNWISLESNSAAMYGTVRMPVNIKFISIQRIFFESIVLEIDSSQCLNYFIELIADNIEIPTGYVFTSLESCDFRYLSDKKPITVHYTRFV